VTTGRSSINRVFPRWAEALGLGDCELRGMDFPLHADPEAYREAVAFIKKDPLALGALVTTHKMDLYAACHDLFHKVDELSAEMGEVSCLYKRDRKWMGKFRAVAVDPYTAGSSLAAFLPKDHWWRTGAEVLILGAGGSAVSLVWWLCQYFHGANRPRCIHVANRSTPRLEHLRSFHTRCLTRQRVHHHVFPSVELHCHHTTRSEEVDALCNALPPGSLVVNATGLGKDAPGSPLTDSARFPDKGLVWEFNYRGELVFLDQARAQQAERGLTIEDGWVFFLHGWLQVIGYVFGVKVPEKGKRFEKLARLAAEAR